LAIATREAYRSYAEIKVWCPKHQRFETWLVPWILLGQAALGLFDTDEWVWVIHALDIAGPEMFAV
jgi:hypothetical protein